MIKLSERFPCYQQVCYYQNPDIVDRFDYVPGQPQASLNTADELIVSLRVSDVGAILQLQTEWTITEEVRNGILREIHRQYRELSNREISLQLANLSNPKVSLAVGNGKGEWRELATAKSSGVSPYTTIFTQQLSRADKQSAIAAFNGNPNYLRLQYNSSVTVVSVVSVSIFGDISEDVKQLTENSSQTATDSFLDRLFGREPETELPEISLEDSLAQIELALAEGRLTLTQTAINQPTETFKTQVEDLAKRNAAQQLLQQVQVPIPDELLLKTEVKERETQRYSIERSVDLSSWFPGGSGTDYIQISPIAIAEPVIETPPKDSEDKEEPEKPTITETTISLGFDPEDLPISKIEIISGEMTATLRRPKFSEVSLSADFGEKAIITTDYTKSGDNFTTEILMSSPQLILQPQDLGLVEVKIDASQVQTKEVKRVRIVLRYEPTGEGSRDTKTINFDAGDSVWKTSWYIITRSSSLDGKIEWYWQETPANGGTKRHPKVITEDLKITL